MLSALQGMAHCIGGKMSEDIFKELENAPVPPPKITHCEYKVRLLPEFKQAKARINPVIFGARCTCGVAPYGCQKGVNNGQ